MSGRIFKIGTRWLAGLLAALAIAGAAQAHRTGESYVYLNVTEDALSGRFEVTFQHLNQVVPLDLNDDGEITKAEFDARAPAVYSYLQPRLTFIDDGAPHPVVVTGHEFYDGAGFDVFAKVDFVVPSLGPPPERLEAEYRFLFDGPDPNHRGLLIIESNTRSGVEENEAQHSSIFRPGQERQEFRVDGLHWTEIFSRFVGEGIYHIVPIGYDHILFLISLLLPSVMVLQGRRWVPAEGFREPFWFVVKVVTFFTIAHSVTLSLAALNIVRLPIVLVEAVIALSIAIVALNNLIPFLAKRTWTVVFALGLFHGFGFANVLDPLGATGSSLIPALAGFNVGVEIGQLIVVGAVFPVLFLIRRLPFYRPLFLQLGSLALIGIAGLWFFERTFDVFGPLTAPLQRALGL